MAISSKYNWLESIPELPKMVVAALALGKKDTTEIAGVKDNPEIMAMAKRTGVANIYKHDETPWCAMAMCDCAIIAGKDIPFAGYDRLRAKSFMNFGIPVSEPMLGDIIVFGRQGGYHVGLYIGEDETHYHVAGGNQSNQFSIIRIEKTRAVAFRRPIYKIAQPKSVKKIFLEAVGEISNDEA